MFNDLAIRQVCKTAAHLFGDCLIFAAMSLSVLSTTECSAGEWSRFRGPNGTGVAAGDESLPNEIGLDKNLLWKASVPEAISSPVIGGGRVFMTTVEADYKLGTMALDAEDGKVLWHSIAPVVRKSKGKRLASATPVTDGKLVISFFDSSGVLCYDSDGELKWKKWFGPLKNQFNHASSPILVDDSVILVVDHDGDSFLVALEKQTGEEQWRSYRFVFGRNYASPVVWTFDNRRFIVVTGSGMVTGYDAETGVPAWYCRATSAVANPTPVVAGNGRLYVHSSSPSAGAKSSPFGSLLKKYDKSDDGSLQLSELPDSFLKTFFQRFDSDRSGGISEREYGQYEDLSRPFVKGMVSIKPGGLGDRSENLDWTESRSMPRTPSALYHQGVLYVVNEGGVMQSIDAESGKVLKKGRIAASGKIYCSPSLGHGKIYVGTRSGEIAVISAEPQWKNLHSAKLGGDIKASPAIADGRIYFRTDTTVYCFGFAGTGK